MRKRICGKGLFIIGLCGILLMWSLDHTSVVKAAESRKLVDLKTVWHYYDKETDPVKSGNRTDWTEKGFDLSEFKISPDGVDAKFGAKKGKLASVDSNMPQILLTQYKEGSTNNIEAYFFRTAIDIKEVDKTQYLTGEILYDDAALVYLNGELIAEFSNKQKADSTKKFDANMQYGGHGDDVTEGKFVVPATYLNEGENILAVELHQISKSSSDIYFQMSSLELGDQKIEQESEVLTVGKDETSRQIAWYCNVPAKGSVRYAKKDGENFPKKYQEVKATVEAAGENGNYSNKAVLDNLESDTEYVYRLVNDDTVSETYSFRTSKEGDFSFFAVGDPQIGASSRSEDAKKFGVTLRKARTQYPEASFLISAGDQVNTAGSESQYKSFLDQMMISEIPIAAAIGNHDSGSAIYSMHYNNPNVTPYGASTAGKNYWYVYNNVLFMHLNSNSESIAEHRAFIKEAVEQNANVDWKIVTFHHSIYSAAGHASQSGILNRREKYVPIFEEFDIDMVLMGHDHVYVRSYMMNGFVPETTNGVKNSVVNPKGILYMTLNSASGSKYYNISGQYDYAAVQSQEKIPTISHIEVSKKRLKITTHRTDDAFSVLDEFSILRKDNIENKKAVLAYTKYTYNGAARKPKVTIKGLTQNVDYKVTYKNNTYPGKATVIITGIGDYTGTISKTFVIRPKEVTGLSVDLIGHDDVKVSWEKATGASGYKIYYKRSTQEKYTYVGYTKKLTWSRKDLRDGYKYIFKIVPFVTIDGERVDASATTKSVYTLKKMDRPSIVRSDTRLKVSWKSEKGVTGYEISRSSKKTGTYIVETVTKQNVLSAKIKATKGKRYYIKVRTYKVVNGKKINGPWSNVKSYIR